MNNEDMDMLEWIVRKIVPIPKRYYWEAPDPTDTTTSTNTTSTVPLPRSILLWHNVVGTLSRAVQWLDRMGPSVADATGLSTSRFDYVLSTMTDDQKQQMIAQRRRHQPQQQQPRPCPEGDDENTASRRSSRRFQNPTTPYMIDDEGPELA